MYVTTRHSFPMSISMCIGPPGFVGCYARQVRFVYFIVGHAISLINCTTVCTVKLKLIETNMKRRMKRTYIHIHYINCQLSIMQYQVLDVSINTFCTVRKSVKCYQLRL